MEFALILPVLMLFIFGIVEFGRAYSARIQLTSAVREGARAVALGRTTGEAQTATREGAPGLNLGPPTTIAVTSCAVPTPPNANATVTVTHPFPYTIPFFGSNTWTLRATGVMRCGG